MPPTSQQLLLIASGFAGGALTGVVSALMRFGGLNFISSEWMQNPLSELVALAAYILPIVYFMRHEDEVAASDELLFFNYIIHISAEINVLIDC